MLAGDRGFADPRSSGGGQYFVRDKSRLYAVSRTEYERFRMIHGNELLFVPPFAAGAACIWLGRKLGRHDPATGNADTSPARASA